MISCMPCTMQIHNVWESSGANDSTMRAFPLSSGCMASASPYSTTRPDEDAPIRRAGQETDGFDERFDEEVGLFDIVLPRASSSNGNEHPKGTTSSLRSICSIAIPKERGFISGTAAEAAEGSSGVENSGNSAGELEPEGIAQSKVRQIEKSQERGGEVEHEEAYVEVDRKCRNENGSTDNVCAKVNWEIQHRTTFGQGDLCVRRDTVVTNVNNSASSPFLSSSAPETALQAEPLEDVNSVNDSVGNSKFGEKVPVPSVPSAGWELSAVSVPAKEGRLAGLEGEEQATERGAAPCTEAEKLNTTSQVTGAVVGENSESEGQNTCKAKSPKSAAERHGALDDGPAEPHVTGAATAAAAYTQGVNCWSGKIGRKTVCGGGEARNELPFKRTLREEKSEDAACEPEEEARELRSAELGRAMETSFRRYKTCETRGGAESVSTVALHASVDSSGGKSGTGGGEEVQVSSVQPGTHAVGPSQGNAEKSRSKQGFDLSTQVGLGTEQLTSLSFERRGRTLVSSRRQLFEQRAAGARVPPRPTLLEQRSSLQQNGEQAENEMAAAAAAAVREDRHSREVSRKGSVVEMLRERYERSTSGSSVGSVRTQRPANSRALSATLNRGKEGKPEPPWRRRQREKLQATQKLTGQASTAADDARENMSKTDDLTCSATVGESLGGGDSGWIAGLGDVVGASPAIEAVEKTGIRTAAETGSNADSQKNSGQRIRRSVITVQSGECSTVTSLKEKFERRHMPSTQGQQQQQTQQSQCRLQQQRRQTLQRSAEGVKSLREQYERRTSPEDNKSCPCDLAATTAPSAVMAKKPLRLLLLKQESELGESSTSRQHSDKDTSGTAAGSPVKCLREQYQRRLQSSATPSPRPATPISIVTSTSVKSARELLGSLDIVGRYGKEYRIAKAEGMLKKEQSQSGGEELLATAADGDTSAAAGPAAAASAGEQARNRDKCCRSGSSKDGPPDRYLDEKASTRRQFTYQSAEAERGGRPTREFDASENGSVLEDERDPIKENDAPVKPEEDAPLAALSMKSQSTVAHWTEANRRGRDEALRVATTESAQRTSHVERTQTGGRPSPAVSARASSKIGALASALGPAFSNFGKAPPPRLLTRAEPEAGTEEVDPEMFGYSKAQEAIERRKRELRFLANMADNNVKEEGNARCDVDTRRKGRSGENARQVCSIDGTKEQERKSNAGEDVARITSINDQEKRPRDADSDEGVSCSRVTQRSLSNNGGSGEGDELRSSSAGTEMSSMAKEQDFNHSGTEGEGRLYDMEDNGRNSDGGRKFSRCISRDLNSCASPQSETETVSGRSEAKTTCGCCSYQGSRVDARNVNDSRGDGEAPHSMKGRCPYSTGHGITTSRDHSSGSCPTDVKSGGTGGEAGLLLGLDSKVPPQISHVESAGIGRTPAKAVARKREAEEGWVLPSTAADAEVRQEDDADTGITVEGRGQVSTHGRQAVTSNGKPQMVALPSDEAEAASAGAVPVAEEETPGSADAPAKADETDLVQEEQEVETPKCRADATEGRSH